MLADRMVAAVAAPPVGPDGLKALLRRLLPTTPVPTPLPKPIPTELESLLQCLLSGVPAPTPTPPPRTGITELETLLQHLLPGTPVPATGSRSQKLGYDCVFLMWQMRVGRCPKLNETFPYMLPRWSVEKVGGNYMCNELRVIWLIPHKILSVITRSTIIT